MGQKIVELVQELEKYPHIRERLEIMLSVAKNSSEEYDLADDVEMKICEEISKIGYDLMEAWGANQESAKSAQTLKNNKEIIRHSKKNLLAYKAWKSKGFRIYIYKTRPQEHAKAYKVQWKVEKLIRTTEQYLGLQDCYSLSLSKQHAHVSSVLLTYALAQVEAKRRRLDTPEKAIRQLRKENTNQVVNHLDRSGSDLWRMLCLNCGCPVSKAVTLNGLQLKNGA